MKHSVSATPTRLRRAATTATLCAVLAAAVAGLVRAAGQTAPAAPPLHDPAVGVHALQERQFGGAVSAASPQIVPMRTATPATSTAQPAATGPAREVLGFAPYWDMQNWTQWQLNRLTTVAYFGVTLDANGNPVADAGWTTWQGQQLTDLVNAAHAAGTRVLVTVKCFDTPTISSIVSVPAHAQAAISTAISLARQRGLDGVDVDFEGASSPTYPTLAQDLTGFMGALTAQAHAALPASEVVIDTYSGSASWDGGIFNIGALAGNVDAFFVMAYDMNFDNTPGHASADAPLNGWTYNDTSVVSQYLAKAPASKIILGVPYYGYKWNVSSPAPNAADSGAAMADTYSGTFDDFACAAQLGKQWDSTAATPFATWWSPATGDPCGGNHNSWREMYYEDVTSIGAKYDLVNQSGLRGTGIWALGYDDGHTELWDLIGSRINVMRSPAAQASQRYVGHVYTDLLGGQDPNGEAFWVSQLLRGVPRYGVVYPFTQTSGYRQLVVDRLYLDELGRPAGSDPGAAWWAGRLATLTPEQVAASLVASDELFSSPSGGNGNIDTYIGLVYHALLGRGPDGPGAAYWHGFLAAGHPRWQMTLDFTASPEWAGLTVDRMYALYHFGVPDPGGRSYWAGRLQSGMRDEQLVASLVSSDRYYGWAQSN
jgi:spore germination protein YaaH